MTTLHDLKQALDAGAELIDNKNNIIYPPNKVGRYSFNHRRVYWAAVEVMIGTPSDWRIRDQITPDPATITVPIDEWNALQKEVKELRAYKQVTVLPDMPYEMTPEQAEWFKNWAENLKKYEK